MVTAVTVTASANSSAIALPPLTLTRLSSNNVPLLKNKRALLKITRPLLSNT